VLSRGLVLAKAEQTSGIGLESGGGWCFYGMASSGPIRAKAWSLTVCVDKSSRHGGIYVAVAADVVRRRLRSGFPSACGAAAQRAGC